VKNYQKKIKIIKFKDGGFHVLIECKINGVCGLMIVDTGATNTIFDRTAKIFENLIFETPEIEVHSVSSAGCEVAISHIDDFRIGKFKTKFTEAAFMSLDYMNNVYAAQKKTQIIGLLGADFLIEHNAILNFAEKTLTITKSGVMDTF
jgi:hypothetical protein